MSRCPSRRTSLSQRGHAIECRIYAEDPAQGFFRRRDRLLLYREPQGPGIRVDSGVKAGSEVSVHYDPMLAKLIVHASTREEARRRAITALREYAILGIRTNIPFLLQILEHPQFVECVDRHGVSRSRRRGDRGGDSDELPPAGRIAALRNEPGTRRRPQAPQAPQAPWIRSTSLGGWRG